MNTSSANLTSVEYLPTNVIWPVQLMLAMVIVLIGVTILEIMIVKKRHRQRTYPVGSGEFPKDSASSAPSIVLVLLAIIAIMWAGFTATSAINQQALQDNVKTAYNADQVIILKEVPHGMKPPATEGGIGSIMKGQKNYRVVITQNPDTFEPFVVSYESGIEIPELEQAKSERMK